VATQEILDSRWTEKYFLSHRQDQKRRKESLPGGAIMLYWDKKAYQNQGGC
jgi:hypothetical protein